MALLGHVDSTHRRSNPPYEAAPLTEFRDVLTSMAILPGTGWSPKLLDRSRSRSPGLGSPRAIIKNMAVSSYPWPYEVGSSGVLDRTIRFKGPRTGQFSTRKRPCSSDER